MATIHDVAKLANVSVMTVSRYFNNPDKVKLQTKSIIEQAVKQLQFTPNKIASALASNRTNIIYVYIPSDLETSHPFVMQMISAIGEKLGEYNYSFHLSRKMYDSQACDGVIAMGLTINEEGEIRKHIDKPLIYAGYNEESCNWVDVDNYQGSYDITKHLIDSGYKKLAYLGINQNKRFAVNRYEAFKDCLKHNNIKSVAEQLVDNKEKLGYRATKILLESNPDVIVCASDLLALGCMRQLNSLGYKVPTDISVTGFDGLGFENLTYPRLTTVKQPIAEMGMELASMMIDMLKNNKEEVTCKMIKPSIIINGSTIFKN